MSETISNISQEYSAFEKEFFTLYRSPIKDTEIGIWGCFSCKIYYELFNKINLSKYKNFIDLGSGDGRVAIIASLFTKSTGIEFDEELYEKSIEMKKKLDSKVSLIKGDFLKMDISKYDIVFINPDKGFHNFEEKFIHGLKGKLMVANDIFLPRFLKKGKTTWIDGVPFVEYTNNKKHRSY